MAQIQYRANLSAKDFVFSSQDWGRSVIMKQFDQNFSRQIVSPTDPDKDIGIPQIYYCHNVMPASQGFQSVDYQQIIPSITTAGFILKSMPYTNTSNTASGRLLFVFIPGAPSFITVWKCPLGATSWTFVTNTAYGGPGNSPNITSANVGGQTYFYIPETNCFTFDGTNWTIVGLTGLTPALIIGISDAFGYMIAWGANTVSWSSTISATDFTPSLITGAGGGGISALRGNITLVTRHTFGFIAFSPYNCVAAVYSGNSRYPFNFREIIGGGGLATEGQYIDLDTESGNLYAWTTAGMQIISVTQAQTVFPDMANFIGGSRMEDFDDFTLTFTETDVGIGFLAKAITVVSDRYLVISYGTTPFTHALVYDIPMKRWGKLKVSHIQVLNFVHNNVDNEARTSFCVLDGTGKVQMVDFSTVPGFQRPGGTIILGKYQHTRNRLITLQEVDIEYIVNTVSITVNAVPTLDGKTWLTPVLMSPRALTDAPQYYGRVTGVNFSLIFQGTFRLDSLFIAYTMNGRR